MKLKRKNNFSDNIWTLSKMRNFYGVSVEMRNKISFEKCIHKP